MPTSFSVVTRYGLPAGPPANAEFTWAVVKKARRKADPMRKPISAAAPADMTTSLLREGSAIRPCTTLTRSCVKYSPSVLPSTAGGASPGAPPRRVGRRTCSVPSKPTTPTA